MEPAIKMHYRLPSKKKVPQEVYRVCKFLRMQDIQISKLNSNYRQPFVPQERESRRYLRKEYGAKFGKYRDIECEKIQEKFNMLAQKVFIQDKIKFCESLMNLDFHSSRRSKGVINIVGLFIGEDLPHRIAATNFLTLLKIVLKSGYKYNTKIAVKNEHLNAAPESSKMVFSFQVKCLQDYWSLPYQRKERDQEHDVYFTSYPPPFLLPYEMRENISLSEENDTRKYDKLDKIKKYFKWNDKHDLSSITFPDNDFIPFDNNEASDVNFLINSEYLNCDLSYKTSTSRKWMRKKTCYA